MGPRRINTTGRMIAGGLMAVFGLVMLIGAYTFSLKQADAAPAALAEPLIESLSWVFMALAAVLILGGMATAAQALRQAVKAQQTGIGSGFGQEYDPD